MQTPPQPPPSEPPLPQPGDSVLIGGLVSAAELNGRQGTVLPFSGSPECLPV